MNPHKFDLQVRGWIVEAVQTKPLISFSDLVNELPGVDPNEIVRGLKELGNITLGRDTPRFIQDIQEHPIKLPVPHPLDYDWRFVPETIDYLFIRIDRLNLASPGLCFLGAPTLFRAAYERGITSPFYLVDASAVSAAAAQGAAPNKVFTTDLLTGTIPDLKAGIVVTDPPWYEEFVRSFLWAAAQIVQPGGTVLLSFPPIGTRPLIEEEWARTEAFAQQLGLSVREKETSLKYQSPPFEQNAMRAAQHDYIHTDWRPGVLVMFEKTGECQVPRPLAQSHQEEWAEQSLLGVRWKFCCQQVLDGSPVLKQITPGDILNSVSRRDPRRDNADVWTSGNRIYSCENTTRLRLITKALAAGVRPDTYISDLLGRELNQAEGEAVLLAARQVTKVTSLELQEYLLNWGG